ncbi:hypothetical protein HanRHA438_Chr10g0446011 [Helianthus annuus]|uniref:Uncharacterized protein n=1 Tax=Helianthus annuus TaxID=4232 RepID=A0A251TLR4_HELAN|nr:hypothetical protein HanRHA438_Chr10g0446011 [Helianthus annuus]
MRQRSRVFLPLLRYGYGYEGEKKIKFCMCVFTCCLCVLFTYIIYKCVCLILGVMCVHEWVSLCKSDNMIYMSACVWVEICLALFVNC